MAVILEAVLRSRPRHIGHRKAGPLKDGSAKNAIEGLSRSGEQYKEAIQCLRSRYDHPHLIHQAQLKKIVDISPIKEGTGKELHRLHDVAQQHLRALKAMKQELSSSFITSLLELKLDASTTFDWQKASQEATTTPHYNDLLEFINLRAQASETISSESRPRPATPRVNFSNKSVTSFTASASNPDTNCILCKTERHPLYAFPQFKSLPHDKMVSALRNNKCCLNCLKPSHDSARVSIVVGGVKGLITPFFTLSQLRLIPKPHLPPSTVSSSHATTRIASNALLMTCQILHGQVSRWFPLQGSCAS